MARALKVFSVPVSTLIKEYNDGKSLSDLSRKYNEPTTTIRRAFQRANVTIRRPGGYKGKSVETIEKQVQEALKLYRTTSMPVSDLVVKAGISLSTFYIYARMHNIEFRGQGKRQRDAK